MEVQCGIAKHESEWKTLLLDVASKLIKTLRGSAVRIGHGSSPSVVGLDANPIIDIQISVLHYDDLLNYKDRVESAGFVFRKENADKTKRYFREIPGTRRTHIHVREAGSFSEQMTLLFRDYLRAHPAD